MALVRLKPLTAEGAPKIPPPRTVGELGRWNEIYRKASGIDAKPSRGYSGLFRSLRSVRRCPVVEVEQVAADPLDGYEI